MKSNKLTRGLYASAAVLMMLSPVVGTMAGTIAGNFGTQVVHADPAGDMSIIIHKYGSKDKTPEDYYISGSNKNEIIDKTTSGTNVEIPEGYEKVANVHFKITRITPKTGVQLKDVDPNVESTFDRVGTPIDAVTNINGEVEVDIPDKGLYIVEEQPSNGIEQLEKAVALIQMPLPIVSETGETSYRYQVNIYPKNQLTDNDVKGKMKKYIDKDNSNLVLGGNITWNMTYEVPASAIDGSGNVTAKGLKFTDLVDERIKDITVAGYVVDGGGQTALINPDDYTAAIPAYNDAAPVKSDVVITMTDAGIKKTAGKQVLFVLKGKINSMGTANGAGEYPVLTNSFTTEYIPSTNVPDTGTTDPKEPNVKTEFGQIDIKKVSSESNETVLAGAKFEVFYDELAQNAVKVADKDAQNSKNEAPSDVLTIETGADGLGHVYGLEKGAKYYIKEIKAPEGYKLSDKIHEVTVGADSAVDKVITNDVDPIYNFIPMTGSQRRIALMAMGATLAVGSMIYVYATKRKKDEEEA